MKVIHLKAYYTPEKTPDGHLTDDLTDKLLKSGFKVEIITPTPTRCVTREERKEYSKRRLTTLDNGALGVYRFPMFPEPKNPFIRALRYFLCCLQGLWYGMKSDGNILFAFSTPPIIGLPCACLKKIKNIPFIYCLQDIFPDSLVNTGMTKNNSFAWKIGRIVENSTYKNADKIIVISEDFKKNIMAKGVPEEKITVIHNWIDVNAVNAVPRDENPLFDEFKLPRDKFYITYAGNIGPSQNIRLLLEAALMLKDIKDLFFVIIGDGLDADNCKRYALDNNLTNVVFEPMQPPERISQVYSLGNASLVACRKGTGEIGMPSKTWSIMSTKTAALVSFDENTEMEKIIKENSAGIFCPADDAKALAYAIKEMYSNPSLCSEYGANGRAYVERELNSEVGTEKYVKVFRELMNA